ncbi:UNKNOWN [Stylonychia lemnae]|uniref:TLDc domain-containing protein n=1 Tax=Stylonychia lemnae TaxID=5949 RepID=A0A078AL66_STYLE|nr:UNKNOWN [Stylonychia lemnae]|eukprot:CDW82621.1 UNKNOWN [Stylonychia lemnae]
MEQELFCTKCYQNYHSDHSESISKIKKIDIQSYSNQAIQNITELTQTLQSFLKFFDNFDSNNINQSISYSSSEFIQKIREYQQLFLRIFYGNTKKLETLQLLDKDLLHSLEISSEDNNIFHDNQNCNSSFSEENLNPEDETQIDQKSQRNSYCKGCKILMSEKQNLSVNTLSSETQTDEVLFKRDASTQDIGLLYESVGVGFKGVQTEEFEMADEWVQTNKVYKSQQAIQTETVNIQETSFERFNKKIMLEPKDSPDGTDQDKQNLKTNKVAVKPLVDSSDCKIKMFEHLQQIASNTPIEVIKPRHSRVMSQTVSSSPTKGSAYFKQSHLLNQNYQELIKGWIDKNKQVSIHLIYKASRDGFKGSHFHKLCDFKGPIICIIQSEFQNLFGGFTSQPLTTPDKAKWIKDPQAFVFSLTHKTKHSQYQNRDRSVYHKKDTHIQFSFDIAISENSHENSDSGCNLGYTYRLPKDLKYGSEEGRQYLGGKYNFRVLEIEVYSVAQPF